MTIERDIGQYMKHILKPKTNNEEKEMEFELNYQLSLTVEERFKMMFEKSRIAAQLLQDNGHRKPFEVIKRT